MGRCHDFPTVAACDLDSGEIKMELFISTTLLFMLGVMCAAVGYASGHRDGQREGYASGRNISRSSATAYIEVSK